MSPDDFAIIWLYGLFQEHEGMRRHAICILCGLSRRMTSSRGDIGTHYSTIMAIDVKLLDNIHPWRCSENESPQTASNTLVTVETLIHRETVPMLRHQPR